jgi:hypothetical protein
LLFARSDPPPVAYPLTEPAVTDRQGIGFGWLQNAWLLHARLKIHRGGIGPALLFLTNTGKLTES